MDNHADLVARKLRWWGEDGVSGDRADLSEAAALIEAQAAEIAGLGALLRTVEWRLSLSTTAIDDWLNTYASDVCDEARVMEARDRIANAGGTLAYIADVQSANRKALASAIATSDTEETGSE